MVVQCRLSTEQQQRLNELRDKLEAEMLTEAERTELLELIERVEAADVERAEALLAMAQKRGISARQLMEDLVGIWAADDTFDEFKTAMETYRQTVDADEAQP